ncbi:LYR motif-containing protein 2 [Ophiocordyceps camponoti-floridani]|uniref:LYR motif-containing protein 2 n=1 Tax=Ophiocordyceps camponoti-floridani TaxID=2030778 RepID=A0A8H4QAE5_9HYPO|nr:LYR motif-containing protein 2 [Ophiocordyceps camponoti-floridani]
MRPSVATALRNATRPNHPIPTLQHFLQRARVLALYRAIMRATGRIADARTRAETRSHVRHEFERYRHVDDLSHIRYLLSTGKTQWDSMERYIDGL